MALRKILNCEYSPAFNQFEPENPWQGGPPHRSSTSPLCDTSVLPVLGAAAAAGYLNLLSLQSYRRVQKKLGWAKINSETVRKGAHILLESNGKDVLPYVGTVEYMFDSSRSPMVHIQGFAPGRDTVLGEVGAQPKDSS